MTMTLFNPISIVGSRSRRSRRAGEADSGPENRTLLRLLTEMPNPKSRIPILNSLDFGVWELVFGVYRISHPSPFRSTRCGCLILSHSEMKSFGDAVLNSNKSKWQGTTQ